MSLEIVIYKSQGGKSLVNQFSNSYLFNGAPNYHSDAAKALAHKLIEIESRIFFDTTKFMRYVCRQLDATGRHIEGETHSDAVDVQGMTAVPVGSVLMPPATVVAYEKKVLIGRNAITLYRNCITSDEYNLYIETGAVPPRLYQSHAPGVAAAGIFGVLLRDADNDSGLEMILPINPRYAAGAARPVTAITFAGIRQRQETYQKDSGIDNLTEAVQQLINENAASLRRLLRSITNATGAFRTGLINTIVSLVVDAFSRYALLTLARRAAIRWPAIYAATELLALLPPGTIPALT